MKARFEIPGKGKGKERPQFGGGHAYTPKQTVEYESWVRICYLEQCRGIYFEKGVPVAMDIDIYQKIPKSVSKKKHDAMMCGEIRPTTRPDVSNVLKSIEDGLNSVAYYDDSQITELRVFRYYSDEPGVCVEIREI